MMMMMNIVGLLGLLLSASLGSSVMLLSSPFDPNFVKHHPAEMMKSTEKLSSKEQEKAVDDHLIVAQEKAAAASEVFDEVTRLLEDVTAGKLAAASDSIQSKPEENFQKTEKCIQETIEKSRDVATNVEHTVLDTVDSAKEKISETAATAKDTAARAVEKTKEAAKGAYDIASSTLGSAKEKTSDVIGSVKERLEEAVDLAKDSKKETSDAAAHSTGKEKICNAAESTENSVLGTVAGGLTQDTTEFLSDTFKGTATNAAADDDESESAKAKSRAGSQGALHIPGDYTEDQKKPGKYSEDASDKSSELYEAKVQIPHDVLEKIKVVGDAQEGVKDKLGVIAQTVGWRWVGVIMGYDPSQLSPYEIVLGDVKYVWEGDRHHHPETLINKILRSIKGVAKNVSQMLWFSGGSQKHKVHQASKGMTHGREENFGVEKNLVDANKDATVNDHYADDAIYKGKECLMEGKTSSAAGKEYKSGHVQPNKDVNQACSDLQGAVGWLQDNTTSEAAKQHRTWKHVFFSRPKGFHLSLIRLLHLFTFSIISGSAMWVTFVSGLILSTSLPRQQFAYVQSRIFPIYLTILATGELVLCLLHSLLHPWFSADRLERWQLQNIVWTLIATLFNLLVLEPRETKALYQKLKLEKLDEGRRVHETTTTPEDTVPVEQEGKQMKIEEINKKLKTLHMYSSALNLLTLAGLMWHLWYLARRCVI
jgi:hypothetical protein